MTFLKKGYKTLVPYVPGEQPKDTVYTKLNTNESPFPPSPKTEGVLSDAINRLRLYSDPESTDLTKAIADYYGVEDKNVLVTNGSDESLAFIFCGFFDKKSKVAFPDISYGFYPVFAKYAGVNYKEIPLLDDFSIDVDAFVNTKYHVVIANPNAPTGKAIPISDIRRILDKDPKRIVVVDEAYVDFGAESSVSLIKEYSNLIVVQTFSKSRQLAGARLGFCIACEELINDIKTVKYSFNPYNVNTLTAILGKVCIEDKEYFDSCRKVIIDNRNYLTEKLRKMDFSVLDSCANFIFAKSEKISGEKLYKELKARKVLVRHFDKERINNYVRITIGTREQIDILLDAIKDILGGKDA